MIVNFGCLSQNYYFTTVLAIVKSSMYHATICKFRTVEVSIVQGVTH